MPATALTATTNAQFVTSFNCRFPVGWSMGWHHHDQHELYLVQSGSVRTEFAGVTLRAGPGELLFYPAEKRHNPFNAAQVTTEVVAVRWRGETGALGTQPRTMADYQARGRVLMTWLEQLCAPTPWHHEQRPAAEPIFALLLAHADEQCSRPPADLVERVRNAVRTNPQQPHSIESLAAENHMSKFHFARKFREEAGATPMQFVRKLRLGLAKRLLLATNLTTEAIAESTGFADASHLGRSFRKAYGQGPREFREANKG
jgi:AraC-like DNA-binding protein/mannose-6-phosphate isomerase-like protein (cupin superfamily)